MTQVSEIPEVKAFMLKGQIESLGDDKLVLITKQTSQRTGVEYADRHMIMLGENTKNSLKAKTKFACVYGELDTIETEAGNRTVLRATIMKPAPAKEGYMNVARLIGKVARAYEFYPSMPGKSAFGNLLLKVGDFFGAGTAFKYAAQKLRHVTVGSTVQMQGRIDYRESDGALRLIIDPEGTMIVDLAEAADPFADHPGVPAAQAAGGDIPF